MLIVANAFLISQWLVNDIFLKLWIEVETFEWSILYLEGSISISKKGTYKFEDQSFILQLTTKDNMTGYRSGIKLIHRSATDGDQSILGSQNKGSDLNNQHLQVLTIKSEATLSTEKWDVYIRLQQNIKKYNFGSFYVLLHNVQLKY